MHTCSHKHAHKVLSFQYVFGYITCLKQDLYHVAFSFILKYILHFILFISIWEDRTPAQCPCTLCKISLFSCLWIFPPTHLCTINWRCAWAFTILIDTNLKLKWLFNIQRWQFFKINGKINEKCVIFNKP